MRNLKLKIILIGVFTCVLWSTSNARALSLYEYSKQSDTIVVGFAISQWTDQGMVHTDFYVEQWLKGITGSVVEIVTVENMSHEASFALGQVCLVFLKGRHQAEWSYIVTGGMFGVQPVYSIIDDETVVAVNAYLTITDLPDPENRRNELAHFSMSLLTTAISSSLRDFAAYDLQRISGIQQRVNPEEVEAVVQLVSTWSNRFWQKREMMLFLGTAFNHPSVNALLVQSLKEPHSRNVREASGWVFHAKPQPDIAEEISAIALSPDSSNETTESAAFVLGEMRIPQGVPALRVLATRHPNPEVRAHALVALGKTRDLDSLPLLERASQSNNQGLRRASYHGLARLDHPQAFRVLKEREAKLPPGKEKQEIRGLLRFPKQDPPTAFTRR